MLDSHRRTSRPTASSEPRADDDPPLLDTTLPGRSLEAQFGAIWQRFNRLPRTIDTLANPATRWRRLVTPVTVSLIVPIQDEAVNAYLIDVQRQLNLYMAYVPQPVEKLHITLALLGYMRTGLPWPGTWTFAELQQMAEKLTAQFGPLPSFNVRIGPINAFPNVAIAEVHDDGQLRLLERLALDQVPKRLRSKQAYPLIPHITLGYFGSRPTRPIIRVLAPLRDTMPLDLRVDQAMLTLYYRGFGPYRAKYALRHSVEEVIETIPLDGVSRKPRP